MWRDWPAALARATGREVFAYSRFGYGGRVPRSSRAPRLHDPRGAHGPPPRARGSGHRGGAGARRAQRRGHHRPARGGVRGGSARRGGDPRGPRVQRAALHRGYRGGAGGVPERGPSRAARPSPRRGDRRRLPGVVRRLARSGVRALERRGGAPGVDVPLLVVQGREDAYGTLRQVEVIAERTAGPARTLVLDDCGHSPHRDRARTTTAAVARFVEGCSGRPPVRALYTVLLYAMMPYVWLRLAWRSRGTGATSGTSASGSGSARPRARARSSSTRYRSERSRPPCRSSTSCWSSAAVRSSSPR